MANMPHWANLWFMSHYLVWLHSLKRCQKVKDAEVSFDFIETDCIFSPVFNCIRHGRGRGWMCGVDVLVGAGKVNIHKWHSVFVFVCECASACMQKVVISHKISSQGNAACKGSNFQPSNITSGDTVHLSLTYNVKMCPQLRCSGIPLAINVQLQKIEKPERYPRAQQIYFFSCSDFLQNAPLGIWVFICFSFL